MAGVAAKVSNNPMTVGIILAGIGALSLLMGRRG
jgi:hypothetical protein